MQQNGALRSLKTATRAREEAGSETYNAPRGPKTLPPGVRPAPLAEVAGPQGAVATGGYVAARAPLLAVSSLRGADGVDDTAVKFLFRAELKKKKKKKEDEERQQELADEALDEKLGAEMDALMAIGPERLTSRQQARLSAVLRERAELVERRKKRGTMRKRKKRSKRKLPSPLLVYGYGAVGKGPALARRRLVVVDVSVNMHDKFQQSPVYSGRCLLPFLRQCGGHSSCATETGTDMDQKDSCSGVNAGFAGYNTPRAVFSFLVRRPMMLDIMAGMDPLAQRPLVLRECWRRDVVWWWFSSWWCLRFCLGQCEAYDWKLLLHLFPVPRGCWVCLHAEWLVQQQRHYLR